MADHAQSRSAADQSLDDRRLREQMQLPQNLTATMQAVIMFWQPVIQFQAMWLRATAEALTAVSTTIEAEDRRSA